MHLNDKVPPAAACAIHYHFLKKVDENFGFKVSSECDNTSERRVWKLPFRTKPKRETISGFKPVKPEGTVCLAASALPCGSIETAVSL